MDTEGRIWGQWRGLSLLSDPPSSPLIADIVYFFLKQITILWPPTRMTEPLTLISALSAADFLNRGSERLTATDVPSGIGLSVWKDAPPEHTSLVRSSTDSLTVLTSYSIKAGIPMVYLSVLRLSNRVMVTFLCASRASGSQIA